MYNFTSNEYIYFMSNILSGLYNCSIIIPLLGYSYLKKKINGTIVSKEFEKNLGKINSISFCGGGCKGIYQVGVYMGLVSTNPKLMKNMHYIGASIGSLSAAICCCNIDINNEFLPLLFELINDYRENTYQSVTTYGKRMREILNLILPENAYELVSERCHIIIVYFTKEGFCKDIISEFESNEDLINCIIASQYIPLWTDTKLFKYRGKYCIDSAMLIDYPILDDNTVIVSFNNTGDIYPEIDYDKNISTYIPQSINKVKDMVQCGKRDGMYFINTENVRKKWEL